MTIPVIAQLDELRSTVAAWRADGQRIALVPTMGALHQGHLDLVRRAGELAERVVVSVFVNPTQFAPTEDFGRYPRDLERDYAALSGTAVSALYAPTAQDMYGPNFSTKISLEGPALGLESITRPHFFAGVALVVTKLFNRCAPDVALFGEKDYQQLKVISRMTKDLDLPVEIIGVPTTREADGLALSSRNVYLSEEERAVAPRLHMALQDLAQVVSRGDPIAAAVAQAREALAAAGFDVDYVEVRDAETLEAVEAHDRPLRVLAAAKLGTTRLIDNIAVPRA
ncbi:pantothenate synthetase 2 [Agaricicola taiwanensis]|uniref:Pantothenate synthetase n=1 Tax=Agaricicola taiwanensis TaxID=591372 RepID=A0A8J3DWX0_9RHOB|nr:pantoate--beta-alanine ligase [Agaricicola taiwanensis]GGE47370.1 pantothenate synthetase 2 [Agaricicola taiwanensis]